MRVTAFSLLLFYVCLNISIYLVAETEVLPYYIPPHESPENMLIVTMIGAISFMTVTGIVSSIIGNWLFGAASLTVWAISYILPIFKWVFWGFPEFLIMIAYTTENPALVLTVVTSVNALMAVVWFGFFMGFVSQRSIDQF